MCNIVEKVRETRLRWFGHVERMQEDSPAKRAMKETVPGKRGRGRPRQRLLDCVREDMSRKGLHIEDAQDKVKIKAADPAANGTSV